MTSSLPYGTWPSIISPEDLAASSLRLDSARYAAGEIWWGEAIPAERGRSAVFRTGSEMPVLPAPWNARSRVHEYGGGAWTVTPEGDLLFVEASDQRVYRLTHGATEPVALTPADERDHHGGLELSSGRLLAVRERHGGARVPERSIIAIPLDGSAVENPATIAVLASGPDFLAQPRLSPDGGTLAWIAWDHPHMAWDDARAQVAALGEKPHTVSQTGSTQVEWDGGDLVFTDDPHGRWNLFRYTSDDAVRAIAPSDADTGGPLWALGSRWFTILADGRIIAVRTNGSDEVVLVERDGAVRPLPIPLTGEVQVLDSDGTRVLLVGASGSRPTGLWEVDVDDATHVRRVRGGETPWPSAWLPTPRAVTLTGPLGDVHGFAYPPANPDVTAPSDELPPYVVLVHGGPTGHVSGTISPAVAFLTSRGIGVFDLNYSGSSGYGRAYRERLLGQWGIADVDDAIAAASALASAGLADPERVAIKGGSAGGLTVLGALERGSTYRAGISRYGVADMRSLAEDTHDYEAHYLDGLVGTLPEDEAIYRDRSPLTHADRISVPVLILQGDEDPVVPPAQSEGIRDALAANGVPHRYILYPGESHGFRQRETLIAAAIAEIGFLGAAFDFVPDGIVPLSLD